MELLSNHEDDGKWNCDIKFVFFSTLSRLFGRAKFVKWKHIFLEVYS